MALDEREKFWDEISRVEEIDFDDEKINRLLRFKALQSHLQGVRKILDVGAATGAFSIPLARMGYEVVHLDLSEEMIRLAKRKSGGAAQYRLHKAGRCRPVDVWDERI